MFSLLMQCISDQTFIVLFYGTNLNLMDKEQTIQVNNLSNSADCIVLNNTTCK